MTAGWSLARGASVVDAETVRFAVWAPNVKRVDLQLQRDGRAREYVLERTADGVHTTTVRAIGPGDDYGYRLDGGPVRPDPVSRLLPRGVHGLTRILDPNTYEWRDAGWRGLEVAELVVYELHVGTFTSSGTFAGVAERLPYLRELGVNAIELMPVAAFPGARNWGYDGVSPYAVHAAYGGPAGLRRLVDEAHEAGLAVILDVVYNHLGPEGNYLGEYGPYFTDRYQTPWGDAVNFDGPGSDEVRRYVIDNALYWVTEFHVDGLRLDAVHAIFDQSATHVLEELADTVHRHATNLGRRVLVIAESDLNDARLIRPRSSGGYGLDAQWSDDFHHAVHARLTGERRGYYVDYGATCHIAKALEERFVLNGTYSAYRQRRHGGEARDVSGERFVICIQNHDQVGNRVRGERLAALCPPEAQRVAAALMLLSPYVPLIFMGEEYGETNPFLYFVSHSDPALVDAVRQGRRRDALDAGWDGESVPDPAGEATFHRSCLSWGQDTAERRGLHLLYRDLMRYRRSEPALEPGVARMDVTSAGEDTITVWLEPGARGRPLCVASNLGATAASLPVPAGPWQRLLWTGDARYGGGVEDEPVGLVDSGSIVLPPMTVTLYGAVGR